jgi:CHASE1-domain containing sensor protein
MKKAALLAALLSPLFCLLEWGGGNSAFLYEVEYQILFQQENKGESLMHPAVFIPMAGQLLLMMALFQRSPQKRWVYAGLALIGLLVLLVLLVGLLSKNIRIAGSTLPFLASAWWCVRLFRPKKQAA